MKVLTPQQATEKIRRYCAYQERSHQEVRNKLLGYGLHGRDVDEILTGLITDGFLNEERFAKAYAGGKFRMKKWGRLKITRGLQAKGVTRNCIAIALREIEPASYDQALRAILEEKARVLEETDPFVRRDRLSRYAVQKGYEPDLVWNAVMDLFG